MNSKTKIGGDSTAKKNVQITLTINSENFKNRKFVTLNNYRKVKLYNYFGAKSFRSLMADLLQFFGIFSCKNCCVKTLLL